MPTLGGYTKGKGYNMFGIEEIKKRLRVIEDAVFHYGVADPRKDYSKIATLESDITELRKSVNSNTEAMKLFIEAMWYELEKEKIVNIPAKWVKIKGTNK